MLSTTPKILRFPARSCLFSVRERCLKAWAWHPLGSEAMQCRVVSHWEGAYDQVVEQADRLDLSVADAGELLGEIAAHRLAPGLLCRAHRRAGHGADFDCIFLHGHLCTREMPPCTGRCPSYAAHPDRPFEQPESL
ncbi:hypothetical protein [Desulfonatronum thioautotrophicum]|uniref:hypothetical protein n=1 Tax=Desulfonatronum thioautotrophicum TaxID=617001 RepID=UPI0012947B96|nr:hypothetical protein [Desulfonatronum thioautotrophicum]